MDYIHTTQTAALRVQVTVSDRVGKLLERSRCVAQVKESRQVQTGDRLCTNQRVEVIHVILNFFDPLSISTILLDRPPFDMLPTSRASWAFRAVRTSIAGPSRRKYASLSPYTPPPQSVYEVFDEPSKSRQKDRALLRLAEPAKSGLSSEGSETKKPTAIVDYIREELAERLAERVEVRRTSIPNSRFRLSGDDEACRSLIMDTLGLENSPIDNTGTFSARWSAHEDPAGDFGRRIGRWRQEEVAGSRGQW